MEWERAQSGFESRPAPPRFLLMPRTYTRKATPRGRKGELDVTAKRSMDQEIRFRISSHDRKRLDWLLKYRPLEPRTISHLIRMLIAAEYDALINVTSLNAQDE